MVQLGGHTTGGKIMKIVNVSRPINTSETDEELGARFS